MPQEDQDETAASDRLYPDRASCGYCYHRRPGGDPVSRLRPGAREGAAGGLPEQHEAARPGGDDVRAGLRRDAAAVVGPEPGANQSLRMGRDLLLVREPAAVCE